METIHCIEHSEATPLEAATPRGPNNNSRAKQSNAVCNKTVQFDIACETCAWPGSFLWVYSVYSVFPSLEVIYLCFSSFLFDCLRPLFSSVVRRARVARTLLCKTTVFVLAERRPKITDTRTNNGTCAAMTISAHAVIDVTQIFACVSANERRRPNEKRNLRGGSWHFYGVSFALTSQMEFNCRVHHDESK